MCVGGGAATRRARGRRRRSRRPPLITITRSRAGRRSAFFLLRAAAMLVLGCPPPLAMPTSRSQLFRSNVLQPCRCQGLRLRAVTIDLANFFAFLVSYMPLAPDVSAPSSRSGCFRGQSLASLKQTKTVCHRSDVCSRQTTFTTQLTLATGGAQEITSRCSATPARRRKRRSSSKRTRPRSRPRRRSHPTPALGRPAHAATRSTSTRSWPSPSSSGPRARS